jgi:hypothetical protein
MGWCVHAMNVSSLGAGTKHFVLFKDDDYSYKVLHCAKKKNEIFQKNLINSY